MMRHAPHAGRADWNCSAFGASISDQAEGLRRLYSETPTTILSVVSNPLVTWSGSLLEHLGTALSSLGRRTLLIDAAETAPDPQEWTMLDLAGAVRARAAHEAYGAQAAPWSYLGARGLLRHQLDAGMTGAMITQAAGDAAPWADVLLFHAPAEDLARLHGRMTWQPLLMADTSGDGLMHAYLSLKRLARRGLSTWDLLIDAAKGPTLGAQSAERLDRSSRRFLSWPMRHAAVIDAPLDPGAHHRIADLLCEQVAPRVQHVH